jgi:uncharacterized membrane protein
MSQSMAERRPMFTRRTLIQGWIENGSIPPEHIARALALSGVTPDGKRWRAFIDGALLALGVLALACAVVFFFAWNWEDLGRTSRFVIVQALMVAALLAWWRLGLDRLTARMALLLAAIALGVLLALFGQTYQTGADPWQLFAIWALLMLPWALVGRFAPLWLLWLALLNLAAALYFDTRFNLVDIAFGSRGALDWALLALNSAAWAAWEFASRRFPWLTLGRWPVRLIATTSGFAVTELVLRSIFDPDSSPAVLAWGGFAAWLAVVYSVYRVRLPDLFMLAGACLAVIVCVTTLAANTLLRGSFLEGGLLLLALLVVGQAAAAAVWLRRVQAEQRP